MMGLDCAVVATFQQAGIESDTCVNQKSRRVLVRLSQLPNSAVLTGSTPLL